MPPLSIINRAYNDTSMLEKLRLGIPPIFLLNRTTKNNGRERDRFDFFSHTSNAVEDVLARFHHDPTDAVPRMTLINFNWPTPAMLFFRSPPPPFPLPHLRNARSLHPYSLCAESIALHRRSLGRERGQCRSSRLGRTTRRFSVDLGAARGGKHGPGTIDTR